MGKKSRRHSGETKGSVDDAKSEVKVPQEWGAHYVFCFTVAFLHIPGQRRSSGFGQRYGATSNRVDQGVGLELRVARQVIRLQ